MWYAIDCNKTGYCNNHKNIPHHNTSTSISTISIGPAGIITYLAMAAKEWLNDLDPRLSNTCTNTSIARGLCVGWSDSMSVSSARGFGILLRICSTSSGVHLAFIDAVSVWEYCIPGNSVITTQINHTFMHEQWVFMCFPEHILDFIIWSSCSSSQHFAVGLIFERYLYWNCAYERSITQSIHKIKKCETSLQLPL